MPHIPQQEFMKEHKRLIRVLREGSKTEQEREAKQQAKEIKPITQSVILSREHFSNLDQAKKWLMNHDYKYGKADITPQYFRFRQRDPDTLKHTHRFRSIELKGVGYLIIAYPK